MIDMLVGIYILNCIVLDKIGCIKIKLPTYADNNWYDVSGAHY